MRRIVLKSGADLDGFRAALRQLIADAVPPQDVIWDDAPALFEDRPLKSAAPVALPKAIAALIPVVVCHRDPERYALLYQLVWRIRHGEKALADIASDSLVHRLARMEKSVRRDLHKMHAFVRFRRVETPVEHPAGERSDAVAGATVKYADHFVAWFEP
jgi:DNA polymerase